MEDKYIAEGTAKIKDIFKLMDNYLIIHSKGVIKNIAVPKLESYQEHKQWTDNENHVFEKAKNIEDIEIGDRVLLNAHIKLRQIEKTTEIVEQVTGKKTTIEILDKKGKPTGHQEEVEKYFHVHIDDIISVVNK